MSETFVYTRDTYSKATGRHWQGLVHNVAFSSGIYQSSKSTAQVLVYKTISICYMQLCDTEHTPTHRVKAYIDIKHRRHGP